MRSQLFLTSILIIFSLTTSNAQYKRSKSKKFTKHEKLQYTAGLGLGSYYGDLCDGFDCMQFRPNFGIGAIYRFLPNISARADIAYFRLYSEDVHTVRNLNFRSWNLEASVGLQYDLYSYSRHFRKRKKIQPYGFASIGAAYYSPKGEDPLTGEWVDLRKLRTEGQATPYTPITIIVPYGGGIRYKFKPKYDFIFELGYRMTFTDYLDDVSGPKYADLNTFVDPVAARMSLKTTDVSGSTSYGESYQGQLRGNNKDNDGYFIFQFKVRYVVGAKNLTFKGKHPLLKPHHK
ncbi:MAG: hypothetical protein EAZ07_02150 [Cytophagales bacterium]|nr:MAG: hypothetical protein EAZ07_02150 [Cytophagales bacterium]